ncbi:MAG: CHASE2 domain-containing protein [Chromatiales bacterium]|nr:CHASE2 domain-containing protein [Chromatiales bacterium]
MAYILSTVGGGGGVSKSFWTSDWLVASVICVAVGLASWTGSQVLGSLERWAYDIGVRGSDRTPSDRVRIIAIDDQSIENLGRWPWPRDQHAAMIAKLHQAGAKVIGNTILYSEPQLDPGLAWIERLASTYGSAGVPIPALESELAAAREALDTDATLSAALREAGNVVLGMTFIPGEPLGNPDAPLPDYISRNAVATVNDRIEAGVQGMLPFAVLEPDTPPIPMLGEFSAAIGHMNPVWDVDGGNRREPLVLRYYDQFYPSIALQVAAKSLNLRPADIEVNLGEGVRLGNLSIRTDPYLQMLTFYYADEGERRAFSVDSFFDVWSDKVPLDKFKDRIVLIGATAAGIGTLQKTPVAAAMAPVVSLAHTVSSILEEDFFVTPSWGGWATFGAFVLVAIYLVVLFPRLSAGAAAAVSLALLVALFAAHYVLMTTQATWIQLMTPVALLVIGHVLLTTKRFLVTERGKARSDADSAETNRMLGLAYQGKGDLDAAFASFRKVPLDDSVMDLLYNLGLDFERKRQFNKAGSVYNYMAEYKSDFRDIQTRMNRSRAMEETVLLGSAGSSATGTLLLDGGGIQKPMLGRYQVEKELGKGAMGVVYLGRDPKINRTVAIKTMALSQEFEADELDDVKERFFREAETAGRLNHPNIVTIFDAGEEHDLAYIAMEFLKGKDLTPYTKGANLLPLGKVLEIVIKSAEALDYAHGENVVHRDIKPANIMYEPDTGSVKLTDFGIARITDSSKTKTGMVLGTPSYMSPEQLAGKKVDGRSDLFSLGVMLFQLVTGRLPFSGDSMATLMFKIANEPHPDILSLGKELPPCLKPIIDRALAKAVNDRYSRGAELAKDLRECLQRANLAA